MQKTLPALIGGERFRSVLKGSRKRQDVLRISAATRRRKESRTDSPAFSLYILQLVRHQTVLNSDTMSSSICICPNSSSLVAALSSAVAEFACVALEISRTPSLSSDTLCA